MIIFIQYSIIHKLRPGSFVLLAFIIDLVSKSYLVLAFLTIAPQAIFLMIADLVRIATALVFLKNISLLKKI